MAFGAVDWVVFASLLLVSLGTGAFFWFRDRKKQSVQDFLFGGRKLKVLPISVSLTGSFISAVAVLGIPAEVYQFGYVYIWFLMSQIISTWVVSYILLPVFEQIKVTSIYEYFEMRFGLSLRISAALLYICEMLLYLSIVLYVPCTVVVRAMGIDIWFAVFALGITCTIYVTFGGLKAVVWTDVFQVSLMFSAVIAVFIQGFIVTNGEVFNIAAAGGRINIISDTTFSVQPWDRHTFWSLFIGGTFVQIANNGCSQIQVQKLLSVPTLQKARIALLGGVFGWIMAVFLCSTCGLVMYAIYGACDPYLSGEISSYNELMPLFVDKFMSQYPGVSGLFVAGLFSGSLSSIAGGITSLAAVAMRDVVKRIIFKDLDHKKASLVTKALTCTFGILISVLTIPFSQLDNLLQAALSVFGWTSGPLFGVFTLGMLIPFTNLIGALAGFWTSLIFIGWIYIGYYAELVSPTKLPLSLAGCPESAVRNLTAKPYPEGYTGVTALYTLSYMWYGLIGWLITLAVGVIVSLLTGKQDVSKVNPKLLAPFLANYLYKNRVAPIDETTSFSDSETETVFDERDNVEKSTISMKNLNESQVIVSQKEDNVDVIIQNEDPEPDAATSSSKQEDRQNQSQNQVSQSAEVQMEASPEQVNS